MSAPSAPPPPPHLNALKARIRARIDSTGDAVQAERTIALVVLGQILLACETGVPGRVAAAIKGGTAMRLRYGPAASRFSRDLDAARADGLGTFLEAFAAALAEGWGGFSGEVRKARSRSKPEGVPQDYVMVAFEVKLRFKGAVGLASPFLTVPLEIGADELDDTENRPRLLDPELIDLFAAIGLPEPHPVPVISDDNQIAQKLHALSVPGSERAHDLIDLQLLVRGTVVPDRVVPSTCRRLFSFHRRQEWPPTIVEGRTWPTLYEAQIGDLDVLPDVANAVQWVNDYILRLDSAL